jgi:hypothetical protein
LTSLRTSLQPLRSVRIQRTGASHPHGGRLHSAQLMKTDTRNSLPRSFDSGGLPAV